MTQTAAASPGVSGPVPWAQQSWSGLEEMEVVIRRLAMPLQLLQLDGGHLGGGVVAIRIGPLRLLRFRIDRRIHAWGPKPVGELTISLDLEPSGVRPPVMGCGDCAGAAFARPTISPVVRSTSFPFASVITAII